MIAAILIFGWGMSAILWYSVYMAFTNASHGIAVSAGVPLFAITVLSTWYIVKLTYQFIVSFHEKETTED